MSTNSGNVATGNGATAAESNGGSIVDSIPALPPTDPETFELRILDPKRMRVFRVAGVPRLTLRDDRSWIKVSVARAFPLSDPDHYLGFLDGDGKDIGLLHDPGLLDPESRQVVDDELEKRYFVPVVERVLSVKEEFGTIYWSVETDRGQKDIIVRNLRDNLQELAASRVIITDVDGNRFEFPDVSKLDGKSQGVILRAL
ncbi:MAG TPA: DUF1854 domain-containing protein [Chthonomonadaceae bacterium]|nr:DUF1854 domain-containing protein [Chthonomonadaceae bacterium]